jgi:uncharacterized protein (TIGR02145 family)
MLDLFGIQMNAQFEDCVISRDIYQEGKIEYMQRILYIFLIFIILTSRLMAQDLIYTVTGETGGSRVSMDSILFENISKDTRIVFGNLPVRTEYIINLTQSTLSETTRSPLYDQKNGFFLVRNQPGILTLGTGNGTETKADVSIYNVLGQTIHQIRSLKIVPWSHVNVRIPIQGVYLVHIHSGTQSHTFKITGCPGSGDIQIDNSSSLNGSYDLKSGSLENTGDFRFQTGDSIRISVYRKSYYAYPKAFRIKNSESLRFVFTLNTSEVSGISNAYADLDGKAVLQSFNDVTGEIILAITSPLPDLKYGDIIVAENDTSGFLRKVTSSRKMDGKLIIQTKLAFPDEVFVNKKVKLNTRWMNPRFQITENSTLYEISNAMEDDKGYCHPVEIIFFPDTGPCVVKSPLKTTNPDNATFPAIDFQKSFGKTEIYGKPDENIHFYTEEFEYSFRSDAVIEFEFTHKGRTDEVTKADAGSLKSFHFSLSGQHSIQTKLALHSKINADINISGEKIIPVQRVKAKFLVDGIPVWIELNYNLSRQVQLNSTDSISAIWGYELRQSFTSGISFNGEPFSFTPLSACESTEHAFPMISEGRSDATAAMTIYPEMELQLFGTSLVKNEVKPAVQAQYAGMNQTIVTGQDTVSFLSWNSRLSAGVETRNKVDLRSFGLMNVSFDSGERKCFQKEIWKSPVSVFLKVELPKRANPTSEISLTFKVTDFSGNAVSNCTVYVEGDGFFSDRVPVSDSNGEAECVWTLTSRTGLNRVKATIFDGDKNPLSAISDTIEVYDSAAYGSVTLEGKTYKTKKFGNRIWMTENLAYLPAVNPPALGSVNQPFYYVAGYNGNDTGEAKKVPGYLAYGVMYNWIAATKGETVNASGKVQGICPPGWYIPGETEWADLWLFLVGNGYGYGGSGNRVAKAMASKTGWNTSFISGTPGNDPDSNDSSEFSGVPGGFRCADAQAFTSEGDFATWWTTGSAGTDNGYHWGFFNYSGVLIKYNSNKARGYFVRCVKE